MPNNDESVASQSEDWLVMRIRAILYKGAAAFNTEDVQPFEGTDATSIQAFEEELLAGKRDRIARVLCFGARATELAGTQTKLVVKYLILIGIRNFSPAGAARRGELRDSTRVWGTNAMQNLLLAALDQQRPDLDDGVRHTDKCRYVSSRVPILKKNVCVMITEIEIDEVPKA